MQGSSNGEVLSGMIRGVRQDFDTHISNIKLAKTRGAALASMVNAILNLSRRISSMEDVLIQIRQEEGDGN